MHKSIYNKPMKRLITSIALAATVTTTIAATDRPHRSASLDNLRIKGILMYDNEKSVENLGLYSYTVTEPVSRRMLTPIPRIYANGGSVAVDNRLYTFQYDIQYGYVNSARYYVYDLTTGEQLSSTSMGYDLATAYSHAAVSSAVDPVSHTVYSSGYEYNDADKTLSFKLKTWDVANNTKTTVGDMKAPLIVMAFDKDGQLWGITASSSTTSTDGGFLIKVDKATGAMTVIGDTGIRPYYDQSAVIDPASGTFYWLANTQTEEANLYTVDLTTAQATLIGAFPNGDEVVAATINPDEYDDAAPSTVRNITLSPSAPYNVEIAFDMPSTSYDGSALTGSLTWTAVIKGTTDVTRTGVAEAGTHVAETVALEASQPATVVITVAKDGVSGPEAEAAAYIGYDKMNAVTDLTLRYADNTNTLTWTAPEAGHFNGLKSADGFRYIIKRMPEGVTVAEAHTATTFTEAVTDDNLRSTYYTVATVNGDVTGDEASSNTVITGSAVTPPYSQDFDLANSLDLYTTVDANKDANTWYYSVKSVKYRQSTTKAADDYLFTPAFSLKAGYSYEFTFDGYCLSTRNTNLLDVVIASAPEAESAVSLIDEPISYNNDSRSVLTKTITIMPETDGKYYIGLHLVSDKSQGTFTIDNVSLSAGKSAAVPAVPDGFDVMAGAKGELKAYISVTAPLATAAGTATNPPLQLTLLRGETVISTAAMNPGETKDIIDDSMTESGIYIYTAKFSNAEGEGEAAEAKVFIGTDSPAAPTDVVLTDNNDGTALVSWNHPARGVNDGYVDTDKVICTILAATGNTVLKTGITGSSATIAIPSDGAQTLYSVKVAAAYTDNATAPATASNEILSGAPYRLPYAESWADATPSTTPWIKEVVSGKSYDTSWNARADNTQDNDGGAADMTAYAAASSRWAGPKIDISEAAEPVVSAYVYLPGGNTRLTLQIQKDNGEWTDLASVDNAADDWVPVTAPLTAYKSKNVRLGLLGECLGGMRFIYVDNITVKDKSSGVDYVSTSAGVKVSTDGNTIIVTAGEELPIALYTTDGRCIESCRAQHAAFRLNAGIYIVKAGTSTVKVVI